MKKYFSFLLSLILCLTVFAGCGKEETSQIEPSEPDNLNFNYLTGLFELPDARTEKRPIAVVINNFYDSWPQYGISKADIIIEIETEREITRLMAIFSDPSDAGYIGSVRGLRRPFLEAVYSWDPIIVHIGTSVSCDELLQQCGEITIDGNVTESAVYVDKERFETYAYEHCQFTNADLISSGIDSLGLREDLEFEMSPAFNFTTDEESKILPADGVANQVYFEFSSLYDGDLRYNAQDGRYYKWQDGEKQIDAGNGDAQLAFDNCLLLFAYIGGIANTELVDVYYAGGGEGYYFSQGRYEKIHWEKPEWDGDFLFTRADGSELVLNTGTTYLAVIRDYFDDTLEIS